MAALDSTADIAPSVDQMSQNRTKPSLGNRKNGCLGWQKTPQEGHRKSPRIGAWTARIGQQMYRFI
jgi:hypothetical protein